MSDGAPYQPTDDTVRVLQAGLDWLYEVEQPAGAITSHQGVIPLVCTGREYVGRDMTPGPVCGAQFEAKGLTTRAVHQPDRLASWQQDDYERRARIVGWRIEPGPLKLTGRNVMCPDCARPDPAIARGLTTGARS